MGVVVVCARRVPHNDPHPARFARHPPHKGEGRTEFSARANSNDAVQHYPRRSAMIIAAPFSAIIMVGALVLPEVIVGMTEASTTRSRSSPITRRRSSTTAMASLPRPILAVPTG